MIARLFRWHNPTAARRLAAAIDDRRNAESIVATQNVVIADLRAALEAAQQRTDALAGVEAAIAHIAIVGVEDDGETLTFRASGDARRVILAAVLAARTEAGR